jgi:hypothetical protein
MSQAPYALLIFIKIAIVCIASRVQKEVKDKEDPKNSSSIEIWSQRQAKKKYGQKEKRKMDPKMKP